MTEYAYSRYLAAKQTVDDRALNQHVVRVLASELETLPGPLQVLEIGAGLGTMVARMIDWGLVRQAEYRLLDVDRQSLDDARGWLIAWARAKHWEASTEGDALRIRGPQGIDVLVQTTCAEITAYLADPRPAERAQLLVANAFLDLVDVPSTLPGLFDLVTPGGLYWFTINFDGETLFQPEHPLDEPLIAAYHRTMDERMRFGRRAGESRCGRHLYHHLLQAGAQVLASGSSDWVVHAIDGARYAEDEAHFVAFILHTIEAALRELSTIDITQLSEWLAVRSGQLATGELLYIARQFDYCGRAPS